MAAVAHAHWPGVGRQGQLVAGARVAEDVAAVAAVVLGDMREVVTVGRLLSRAAHLCKCA